ncbi:MbcA/ParS/Xre antitoxin family protein [Vibrio sp. 10N.222.54.F12]|uniref:MbcA/ParS/Xre antitoxin family protein n=1 Tax=Vibrio TaxID=662 RepID=UPI000C819917|nr:MbcA/ParS/Xre antitoxin family protein [Vibrio tasmaniensis]PML15567.1 hypothetical protein BCT83_14670 [Vibrio tasmaniensis]
MVDKQLIDEQLERHPELKGLLEEVFNGDSLANEWLNSPIPIFSYQSPINLLQQGHIKYVIDILNRMKRADFS